MPVLRLMRGSIRPAQPGFAPAPLVIRRLLLEILPQNLIIDWDPEMAPAREAMNLALKEVTKPPLRAE
jgi:hypothetical protein